MIVRLLAVTALTVILAAEGCAAGTTKPPATGKPPKTGTVVGNQDNKHGSYLTVKTRTGRKVTFKVSAKTLNRCDIGEPWPKCRG